MIKTIYIDNSHYYVQMAFNVKISLKDRFLKAIYVSLLSNITCHGVFSNEPCTRPSEHVNAGFTRISSTRPVPICDNYCL